MGFLSKSVERSKLYYSEETNDTVGDRVSAITIDVDKYTQMMWTQKMN